jgi:hypothetical protein
MATKDTPVTDEKSTTVETKTTKHHLHHSPLWWVLGTLAGVLVLMLIAGAVRHHMWQQRSLTTTDFRPGQSHTGNRYDREGRGGAFGGGMMGGTTNNSTMVSGVITAIDGATLTVAGNGTTKAVITNDDTTEYFGAAQPVKVNDSVRITGTTSGDAFTATRVMIHRQ